MKKQITYAQAGVDIAEAERAVKKFKNPAKATYNRQVLEGLGAFGGLFELPRGYRQPVLVGSLDGVGTKIRVAIMDDKHHTVGQDLVNHCVNDIAVQGARPLYFLDYFAAGKVKSDIVAAVVKGVAAGCLANGVVLLGGETAEMPGFYTEGTYDLAGAITGVAEKSQIITPKKIRSGDLLIGLPSSGLHTNGYSLARKLFFEEAKYTPGAYVRELRCTVGEELLKIHKSYLKPLQTLLKHNLLHGAAHITGGGITDNLPRILPSHLQALVFTSAWEIPPVFQLLRRIGNIPLTDFRRTFNLGIGMILAVPAASADEASYLLEGLREPYAFIGEIRRRNKSRKALVYTTC